MALLCHLEMTEYKCYCLKSKHTHNGTPLLDEKQTSTSKNSFMPQGCHGVPNGPPEMGKKVLDFFVLLYYIWLLWPWPFLVINLFSTGQADRLNTKEDSVVVGKKRCSWERRKERDEEREQYGQEKDEVAKEHKSASLQQSESFTQQMYCHGSGTRKYIPALSFFL